MISVAVAVLAMRFVPSAVVIFIRLRNTFNETGGGATAPPLFCGVKGRAGGGSRDTTGVPAVSF